MKMKYILFAASLLLLAHTPAFATPRPCPGELLVTGEWVYLRPIIDNPYEYIDAAPTMVATTLGPRVPHELSFHAGYRVELLYGLCGQPRADFRASWLSFQERSTLSDFAASMRPAQGNSRFIEILPNSTDNSRSRIDLNRFEGVMGLMVAQCNFLELSVEGGVQYSDLRLSLDINYDGPTVGPLLIQSDSKFWGVGPQFGLDFNYYLLPCLFFSGKLSSALLVGEMNWLSLLQDNTLDVLDLVNIQNDSIWRIVPSFEIRVGLDYAFRLFRMRWVISGGYQFFHYVRVFDSVLFPSSGLNSLSQDFYSNAGFHGPYASLTLTF